MAYTTKRGEYYPWNKGPQPVIELLIDNHPWGQAGAQTFRFGNRICRMLLSGRAVLEEFLKAEGRNPETINRTIPAGVWMPATVVVQGYSEFQGPAGRNFQKPFLKFSCNESREKGIGLLKAEGLLAVWSQLEAFANDVGMPPIGRPANSKEVFG